ncbi:MAG: hypothetical protein IJL19_06625 [Clostridiales bacterium]|nr:hypothetical protein [Clostridiales bacterium]
MHDVEPNQARRVRSADAAVFKAVEHEAALEREAELKARREAQRNAEAAHTGSRQVPLNTRPQAPQLQPGQQAPRRVLQRNAPVQGQASLQRTPAPQRAEQRIPAPQRTLQRAPAPQRAEQRIPAPLHVEQRPSAISTQFVEKPEFGELEQHMPVRVPERAVLHRGAPAVQHEEIDEEETEEVIVSDRAAKREAKREARREVKEAKREAKLAAKSESEEAGPAARSSEVKEEKPKKTRKSVKEANAYGIKRKRRFVLPLLIILLLEIIIAVFAVAAITIYNEDTDLIVREHTIEAGTSADVSMYITGEPRFPDYVSCNLDFSTVNYNIPQTIRFTVRMYGTNFPCELEIVDTTPPLAEAVPHTMFSVDEIPPVEECVTNVYDLNEVTIEWLEVPDITQGGDVIAKAAVTDNSGNCSIVDVPFYVTKDTEAPVIEGTHDIEVYIGDPIGYRDEVTVTDDIDPKPTLEIDTSEVTGDEPGTYVVTYRAKDFTGNTSEVTINLKLKKKPSTYVEPDVVYAEAQKVLDKITNSDMSDMEKALQITYWVRYNVYYVSNCDDSSWTRAAYDGFTKRSGNCYTFAMCAKALFDVAGIENMIIVRDPYIYNPHYWNYIKINDQWYHCDSTPRIGWSSYFFMYTTKELKNFWHNGWNGYNFPEDKYPESATESVQNKINYSGHSIKG